MRTRTLIVGAISGVLVLAPIVSAEANQSITAYPAVVYTEHRNSVEITVMNSGDVAETVRVASGSRWLQPTKPLQFELVPNERRKVVVNITRQRDGIVRFITANEAATDGVGVAGGVGIRVVAGFPPKPAPVQGAGFPVLGWAGPLALALIVLIGWAAGRRLRRRRRETDLKGRLGF